MKEEIERKTERGDPSTVVTAMYSGRPAIPISLDYMAIDETPVRG